MKKVVLAALLLTSVSSFAFSGGIPTANAIVKTGPILAVPTAVQQSFNIKFSNAANVKWGVESSPATLIYVVDFVQSNPASLAYPTTVTHVRARFTVDGTFLGKQFVFNPM